MAFSLAAFRLQYRECKWEKKVLLGAGALSLIPLLAVFLWRTEPIPQAPEAFGRAATVDTYIPRGFVLVPIEALNYEALDSILGRFAIVDLYHGGTPEMPAQGLVARNVRLLRAPQNPGHFAILVREAEAAHVLRWGSQFTVIVKRPAEGGTEFVKEAAVQRRRIIYEGEAK
jgi:hypothetical protein